MIWVINCKVEGGFTGTREALLKNHGELVTFKSEAQAGNYAEILTTMANNVYATAQFTYQPMRQS